MLGHSHVPQRWTKGIFGIGRSKSAVLGPDIAAPLPDNVSETARRHNKKPASNPDRGGGSDGHTVAEIRHQSHDDRRSECLTSKSRRSDRWPRISRILAVPRGEFNLRAASWCVRLSGRQSSTCRVRVYDSPRVRSPPATGQTERTPRPMVVRLPARYNPQSKLFRQVVVCPVNAQRPSRWLRRITARTRVRFFSPRPTPQKGIAGDRPSGSVSTAPPVASHAAKLARSLFIHWPINPSALRPLVPEALDLDRSRARPTSG